MRRGRSYWKMNTALLCEKGFKEQLRQRWAEWSKQTKNYPTMVMWWERVANVHIKKLFIHERTLKRREETQTDNFYYACLYDILQCPSQHAERRAALNHLKAKIVKLHNARLARGQNELRTQDIFQEERMSLFHLIKRRQRRGSERSQKCFRGNEKGLLWRVGRGTGDCRGCEIIPQHKTDSPHPRLPAYLRPRNGVHGPLQTG